MKLLMYGVNRDLVEHSNRDRYQLTEDSAVQQMQDIKQMVGVTESTVLFSEHRTEYYFVVDEKIFNHGDFLRYLSTTTEQPLEKVILETFSKFNYDVIAHVYRHLTGIDDTFETTEELIDAYELSLCLSDLYIKKKMPILKRLFQSGIFFVITLLKNQENNMLFNSVGDNIIKEINDTYTRIENRRFLIAGADVRTGQIAKMLFRSGARYVKIFGHIQSDNDMLVDKLNQWANWLEGDLNRKVFFSVSEPSIAYHLTSADLIVITNGIDLRKDSKEFDEIEKQWQAMPKKQLIIDLNKTADIIAAGFKSFGLEYKNLFEIKDNMTDEHKEDLLEKLSQKVSLQIQQIFEDYNSYVKIIEN